MRFILFCKNLFREYSVTWKLFYWCKRSSLTLTFWLIKTNSLYLPAFWNLFGFKPIWKFWKLSDQWNFHCRGKPQNVQSGKNILLTDQRLLPSFAVGKWCQQESVYWFIRTTGNSQQESFSQFFFSLVYFFERL